MKFKVGFFTLLGLFMILGVSFYVNDQPFWWRPCEAVHIYVDDASGLLKKSPVRSLGIQIGYLNSVELAGDQVRLNICITAPVEVSPRTRAYIRGEGFLGDKFVELRPVKSLQDPDPARKNKNGDPAGDSEPIKMEKTSIEVRPGKEQMVWMPVTAPWFWMVSLSGSMADAANPREIPVGGEGGGQDMQKVVDQMNSLMEEMTSLTRNLKSAVPPQELRDTLKRLNETLENASKTLSPEGSLTSTAQRTLAKLETAIEQMRDTLTRINQGQGSVGRIIHDEEFAKQLELALKNLNFLLNKASNMRIRVNVGLSQLPAFKGTRGSFLVEIWPSPSRYYLIGVSVDPRGVINTVTTTTEAGGSTATSKTTMVDRNAFQINLMLGKVLWNRLEGRIGLLHGDAMGSVGLWLGPNGNEDMFRVYADLYSRSERTTDTNLLHVRTVAFARPFSIIYVMGGLDSLRKFDGQLNLVFGGGIEFDDDDIKLLFSFL